MFMSNRIALLLGLLLWAAGTLIVGIAGQILPSHPGRLLTVCAGAFLGCALLVRAILAVAKQPVQRWAESAAVMVIPTLVLDPVTTAYFGRLFPSATAGAGAFAALMLASCGGGLVAALVRRPQR
jgi:hypothetical protein